MTDLRNLLKEELQDLYDAEQQIVKALPRMVSAASDEELRTAFEEHLEETRGHVERLERAFGLMDETAQTKPCKGIRGILSEGEEALEKDVNGAVKDALLIAGAQRVEHYEIAAYGTAASWADELGLDDVADLLGETLDEEEEADSKLTKIAEGGLVTSGVNESAKAR